MSPQGIGFWHRIYQEQMPDAKFIYQDQSQVYSEILNYSSLPFFTTNLTNPADDWGMGLPQDRIVKPLTDKLAHQQFYAAFLTRHQERLHPLIERLQDQWDRLDATATYSPDTPSSS
ncbi:transcriptional regulator [Levilactobacillus namurensis]|uniref:Transcriptional regulator n=1 Tax=Levilactobacillus namurensis TaxID=380393 RepID=A0AAW8W2L4_9LACO|nr:transcriptional regulator [Levilactobacillus namurensis]MDT7013742.1 transcriptional regulator [Levilactobacillus namurensis]